MCVCACVRACVRACVCVCVTASLLCQDHVYVLGLLMGGERDSPITQHHVLFAAVQLYTNLVCILCDASAFLYLLLLKSCGADAEGRW